MANADTIRASRAEHRLEIPGGSQRARGFPSQLRMKLIQQDSRQLYEVDGYATVFDRGYEMWDMFGAYKEIMSPTSLDRSLMNGPDVAFLVNHKGVTMARTTKGSLTVEKDSTGLAIHAFLNADRQDVRDLASAIGDGLIDEMSFAFMLNDGVWNDNFDTFTITEADINRGDVSAVNYGANPYTSIQARSADWLADIERMPVPVALAAAQRIRTRLDTLGPSDHTAGVDRSVLDDLGDIKNWPVVDMTGETFRVADHADDPAALMSALDSMIDQACDLMGQMDMSMCPPEAASAMDLMMGADAIADQLMSAMGIADPADEPPAKPMAKEQSGGKSTRIWRMRLDG